MRNHSNYGNLFMKCKCRDHTNFILFRLHNPLSYKESTQFTGTTLVDYLCSIISSRISLLKQFSHYVPENIQKIFFQCYILPMIDSASNSWGSTSNTNIERVNKLQKRAARIILKADYTTTSADVSSVRVESSSKTNQLQ